MSETGFYRVFVVNRDNQKYYKYQIRNQLIRKEITRKDIYELKQAVEKAGLLWGITDIDKAKTNKGDYSLYTLQGKYGLKIDK